MNILKTMIPEASHQPVIFEMIHKTTGPILELGAGESSTRQIHELAKNRMILTIDDNLEWVMKYSELRSENHRFVHLREQDCYGYFELDNTHWSVVLVDLSNWNERMLAINKYKDTSDYVIIHDSQNRDLGKLFKFWKEYEIEGMPSTLLGSNKYEL